MPDFDGRFPPRLRQLNQDGMSRFHRPDLSLACEIGTMELLITDIMLTGQFCHPSFRSTATFHPYRQPETSSSTGMSPGSRAKQPKMQKPIPDDRHSSCLTGGKVAKPATGNQLPTPPRPQDGRSIPIDDVLAATKKAAHDEAPGREFAPITRGPTRWTAQSHRLKFGPHCP
ncbi:hypothetical protein PG999_014323 [Apiospora kogelbergensis]|uniref:Uncharacterized protein n=1 Tax=Apiospora kogelbergensis TaxID=1337665 RepID=A0AAW0Q3X8_9PEZI